MDIIELENGDLQLVAEDGDLETCPTNGYWSTMAHLFEPYSTNGGFAHFDAALGNPFVGLTGAPCIAECMDHDDGGNATIQGRFWYFSDYMVKCELEMMAAGEPVIYTLYQAGE